MQKSLLDYIYKNIHLLKNRDFLIEIMTECQRIKYENPIMTETYIYKGKLLLDEDETFVSIKDFKRIDKNTYEIVDIEKTGIKFVPLLTYPRDKIILPVNILKNNKETLNTTVGRLILNYLILSEPFGDLFDYINDSDWSTKRLMDVIFQKAVEKKITSENLDMYTRNLYFIGHMTEICVPNFSERSLTTDPNLAKRRKELLEKHRDAIDKGDSVIMSQIEDELIAMDKKWLEKDPVIDFYKKDLKKSFDIQRKKMFVTHGMVSRFGSSNEFDFIETPLSEGVQKKDFPIIANEIRNASYARAIETRDGGVTAKSIGRALQNARIIEKDCGTKRTMSIRLNRKIASMYLYKYILEAGRIVCLEDDVIEKYIGKTVKMRSPMTCETKGGFCVTCLGKVFESLDQESLTVRALELSAYLLKLSLKKSHGLSYSTFNIDNLNDYLHQT